MPGFKKFKPRSRRTAKKPTLKTEVKKLEKSVRKIMPETKLKVTNFTSTLQNSAPIVNVMNLMSQGTQTGARVANRIKMTSLEWRYQISINNAAYIQPSLVRVLLIYENDTQGNALTTTDIFNSTTPSTISVYNKLTRNFYKNIHVLYDKTHLLCQNGYQILAGTSSIPNGGAVFAGASCGVNVHNVLVNKKMNKLVDYSRGNAGTISDVDSGALYQVVICDQAVGAYIQYTSNYNLGYIDD